MNPNQAHQLGKTHPGGNLAAVDELPGGAEPVTPHTGRFLPASRYRHPGDVIRLIVSAVVLTGTLAAVAVAHSRLLSPGAPAVTWPGSGPAGRLLTGLVQVAFVVAAAGIAAAALRHRRFRLLAGLTAAAAAAGATLAGILYLAGDQHPHAVTAATGHGSWLASAAFPCPALLAAAAAVTVAAAPWLSRPWRRTAWITLGAAAAARLITGTVLPAELILAFSAGVTVGAGVLVTFGVPDRRIGPGGIAAALRSAGLQVTSVDPAGVEAKGSRPFAAATDDGQRLFIKALGADQRDADLLYRAYRYARLRNVGDTWPAASVIRAVEHQALITVMAERAGVRVPRVDRVIKSGGGTALLVMDRVDGSSRGHLPAQQISDDLLRRLWAEVDRLHRAGIAHRSLRAANVMVDDDMLPRLTDFSFSELAATQRQKDLDLAELLASLAILAGPDRAVSSAAAVIGAQALAAAVPLLQPLALSAATRRAIARHDGLLAATRSAAAAASGLSGQPLARLQRVRPRTLLAIAAAAGAFYFILPQLAQVSSSWHALQSAHWAWLPVIIAASALTYLASAAALIGAVPGPVPFWPATLTQAASSFVNRVSPANVGGMALNARLLQKNGVPPQRRRRRRRSQRPDGSRRAPDPARHLLHPGRPPAGPGLQAAARQQTAAPPRHRGRAHRNRPGHPPGQAIRHDPAGAWPAIRRRQPADRGRQPGQADPAGRRLRADHPGLHRRPRRLGTGIRRRSRDHRDRRRLPRHRTHRRRLPHPRRPRRHRSRPRRRPHRHRHRPRARRISSPRLPARHLLAARPTRMDLPADPAKARLHMTPGRQETCLHERAHRPGTARNTMMPGPGLNRTAIAPPQTEPGRIDRPSGQARAFGPDGATTQAWLQTGDACASTAAASLRAVAETLTRSLRAAFSPAAAFGAGFAPTIPDTTRTETIPADPPEQVRL